MSPARPVRRRRPPRRSHPVEVWQPVPELARPAPIRLAPDPTALLRSLGQPPLANQSTVAQHYMVAVVERAAGLAAALAATADLLAPTDAEELDGDEGAPA